VKGFNWRQEKEWERAAWMSSHVIASMTGKRYSVNKLLGREGAEDEEEDQSEMAPTEKFEVMWARWEEKKEEKKKEMQHAKRPGDS